MDRLRVGEKKDVGAAEDVLVVLRALYCRRFWKAVVNLKHELKKDSIGVCIYPTKHANCEWEDDKPPSKRSTEKQMVRNYSHTCSWHSLWLFPWDFALSPRIINVQERSLKLFFCYVQISRSAKSRMKTLEEPEATANVTSGPFNELSRRKQPIIKIISDFYFRVYLRSCGWLQALIFCNT